jgi:hypothetical protein
MIFLVVGLTHFLSLHYYMAVLLIYILNEIGVEFGDRMYFFAVTKLSEDAYVTQALPYVLFS